MDQIVITRDPATNAVRVKHNCADLAALVLLLERVKLDLVAQAGQPTSPIADPRSPAARRFLSAADAANGQGG